MIGQLLSPCCISQPTTFGFSIMDEPVAKRKRFDVCPILPIELWVEIFLFTRDMYVLNSLVRTSRCFYEYENWRSIIDKIDMVYPIFDCPAVDLVVSLKLTPTIDLRNFTSLSSSITSQLCELTGVSIEEGCIDRPLLQSLKNVKWLSIWDTPFNLRSNEFQEFKNLTRLELMGAGNHFHMNSVKGLKKLESLQLASNYITLDTDESLPSLREIWFEEFVDIFYENDTFFQIFNGVEVVHLAPDDHLEANHINHICSIVGMVKFNFHWNQHEDQIESIDIYDIRSKLLANQHKTLEISITCNNEHGLRIYTDYPGDDKFNYIRY